MISGDDDGDEGSDDTGGDYSDKRGVMAIMEAPVVRTVVGNVRLLFTEHSLRAQRG